MNRIISLIVMVFIIFAILSVLPLLLLIFVPLLVIVYIYINHKRKKILDEQQQFYQEQGQTNTQYSSTSSNQTSNDVFDVEYTETEE